MPRRIYSKYSILFSALTFLIITFFAGYSTASEKVYGAPILEETQKNESANSCSGKVDTRIQQKINQMNQVGFVRKFETTNGTSTLVNSAAQADIENNIHVYIHVNTSTSDVRSILESKGTIIEIFNQDLDIIQAWIPAEEIYEIAQISFVERITTPTYAKYNAGSVTSEGYASLKSDKLLSLGFDGAGIKVGTISDGVENRVTSIASGDLPSAITIFGEGSGDEGTAMLEIIHDMAPKAELGFCGAATNLEMIECLSILATDFGANIVVDDLLFPEEPYYEDGPVAQAVENILSNRLYISSAGNYANMHYTGSFLGTNIFGFNHEGRPIYEHNFGLASGGVEDPTLGVMFPSGVPITIVLQWNDPFGESGNDYDLHLLDSDDKILFSSKKTQNGDDDPIETLNITVTTPDGSPSLENFAVTKWSGIDKEIKIYVFGGDIDEYPVSGGSIFGHPSVPGVIATAAVDPVSLAIEDFSSQGPVKIFYPSPETRQKPDISAVDRVSVTGAGGLSVPFIGTSAAAPHVAGIAAQLIGMNTTSGEVAQAIRENAVDFGKKGFDTVFGHGLVDAFAAAQSLNQPPDSQIDEPNTTKNIKKGEAVNFSGTIIDSNGTSNVTYLWKFGAGSGIPDNTNEDPGQITFNIPGNYSVTFTGTDGFGASDQTPAIVTVNVSEGGGGDGGGGGGCFLNSIWDYTKFGH